MLLEGGQGGDGTKTVSQDNFFQSNADPAFGTEPQNRMQVLAVGTQQPRTCSRLADSTVFLDGEYSMFFYSISRQSTLTRRWFYDVQQRRSCRLAPERYATRMRTG